MTRTIVRFSPHNVTAGAWARAETIVKNVVTRAEPDSVLHAEQQLSIVAQLVLWADRLGQPLDPDWLFSPEIVDRFVVEGCAHLSSGSQLNYRTHLRRIGAIVLGQTVYPEKPLPIARSPVLAPYSDAEVTDLVSWCRGLPTEHMRRNVSALLAIGIGAGLTSAEILRLSGTDVGVDDEGTVIVEVKGNRPRTIPVDHRWATVVLEHAHEAGTNHYFMPNRRRVTRADVLNFVERCSGERPPRLNVQRLRVTWIVNRLSDGVHLKVLEDAAGVGVLQLGKYLEFAAAPGPSVARSQLVGAV